MQSFKTMDVDGSGKLNEQEFRTALSAMQIVTDEVVDSNLVQSYQS